MTVNAPTPVDPRYMTFEDWASEINLTSRNYPRPGSAEDWRDWAAQVWTFSPDAPDPTGFADWRLWAMAWMQTF